LSALIAIIPFVLAAVLPTPVNTVEKHSAITAGRGECWTANVEILSAQNAFLKNNAISVGNENA